MSVLYGFIHDASSSVARFLTKLVDWIGCGGQDFTATPTGSFTYEGMNIMRYSADESSRGQIQDGTFTLTCEFC